MSIGVAALRELVYQFKNHGFFHSMCKALYDAVDAEASGNRKRFFSWQKKILDMWAEEEQRMRSTLDTAAALVAAIPTPSDAEGDFEDSQDGEEQDDAEDADDGQDEGDPSL